MALGEEEAADVVAVSARLARKRAPAFYFEHTEDAPAAEEAAADARRDPRAVHALGRGHPSRVFESRTVKNPSETRAPSP